MNIIPSIDLYEGRVVRLRQGDFNNKCVYDLNPLEIIKQYEDAGYTDIHIVDLTAAKKGQIDKKTFFLVPFLDTKVNIQFGGGIRKLEDLHFLFSKGIDRVVIGSMAAENSDEVQNWIDQFGTDRVILAIDIRLNNGIPMVKTQGWIKDTALSLYSLLKIYDQYPDLSILCTDIDRDGLLEGANVALYQSLVSSNPKIKWIASGGVKNLKDLYELNNVGVKNVVGGKALYEKQLTLTECQEAMQW